MHPLNELIRNGFALVEVAHDNHLALLTKLEEIVGRELTVQADEIVVSTAEEKRYRRSMTATYGLGEFPLHTDRAHDAVPPRFILLSKFSGSAQAMTRVAPTQELPLTDDARSILRHEVWRVLYGRRRFLTPILNDTLFIGDTIFRYDPCCMTPAIESARTPAIMHDAIAHAMTTDFELAPDRTLVIDNWSTMHGRSAISDPQASRSIQRTLVRTLRK